MPDLTEVPMPPRVAKLPRDRRGYPIPHIVQRDPQGLPLFTVNDANVTLRCIKRKLCPICGDRLDKTLWFVGGPSSAFHPQGVYFDTAMHHECMVYALKVCPYMANPNYHIMTNEKSIAALENRLGKGVVDNTQDPGRPRPMVAVMCFGQTIIDNGPNQLPFIRPLHPYHGIEFWNDGAPLLMEAGLRWVAAHREFKQFEAFQRLRLLPQAFEMLERVK